MAAVAGLRGSGDFGADERPKSFREMIMWRKAAGMSPITALLGRAKKETVGDPEFSWWDEPVTILRLQVNGALTSGATTVVVDSADPSASAPANDWGVARHLVPGDMLQVEKTTETTAYDNELLEVQSVISDTEFVVRRGAAGTTAASIADNAFLLKVGNAYPEGSASPKAASRNPIKYFNFMQVFKTSYEVTLEASRINNLRTGDVLRNEKMRRTEDHQMSLEQALMWGVRHETTGENGKPKRFTGGLRFFIPAQNVTIFSAAVTISSFLDAVYKVFDWQSPAGDERIAFVGNLALNELNKMIQTSTNARMDLGEVITVYGLKLRELRLPQGTLFLRTHPLLNRNTKYSKSMFLVDFSSLRWRYQSGGDTQFMDNIQAKDERLVKGEWYTHGGLEVFYGGLTNGYLGNISAT